MNDYAMATAPPRGRAVEWLSSGRHMLTLETTLHSRAVFIQRKTSIVDFDVSTAVGTARETRSIAIVQPLRLAASAFLALNVVLRGDF